MGIFIKKGWTKAIYDDNDGMTFWEIFDCCFKCHSRNPGPDKGFNFTFCYHTGDSVYIGGSLSVPEWSLVWLFPISRQRHRDGCVWGLFQWEDELVEIYLNLVGNLTYSTVWNSEEAGDINWYLKPSRLSLTPPLHMSCFCCKKTIIFIFWLFCRSKLAT